MKDLLGFLDGQVHALNQDDLDGCTVEEFEWGLQVLSEKRGLKLNIRRNVYEHAVVLQATEREIMRIVAVLSTTVLPLDGTYEVKTLPQGHCPILTGILHYVEHPDTKGIVEGLGAVQAPTKLFSGLQPGEQAVCSPIAQGKSTRANEGFTTPHQSVDISDLSIRVITRLA